MSARSVRSYLLSTRAIRPSRKSRRLVGELLMSLSSFGSNRTTGRRFFGDNILLLWSLTLKVLLIRWFSRRN